MVSHSGCSSGISIQLSIAPEQGVMNFHRLSSDTLTPGRCKSLNQIEKADAAIKLNQNNATQYSPGNGPFGFPSTGIEMR
jgi:hypothetical protein